MIIQLDKFRKRQCETMCALVLVFPEYLISTTVLVCAD